MSFRAVRLDNVSELFLAIFDAARWPSSIFRGVAAFVFTFVVPLALMTTVPAQALLGEARGVAVFGACAGCVGLQVFARVVWVRSIAAYTSASS